MILRAVESPALPAPVCRDPDDDAVLACALAAGADHLVSGDDDLRVLRRYGSTAIVGIADALTVLASVP